MIGRILTNIILLFADIMTQFSACHIIQCPTNLHLALSPILACGHLSRRVCRNIRCVKGAVILQL